MQSRKVSKKPRNIYEGLTKERTDASTGINVNKATNQATAKLENEKVLYT